MVADTVAPSTGDVFDYNRWPKLRSLAGTVLAITVIPDWPLPD